MIVTQKPYTTPRATAQKNDQNFGGLGRFLIKKAGNEVGQTIKDFGFIGKCYGDGFKGCGELQRDMVEKTFYAAGNSVERKA